MAGASVYESVSLDLGRGRRAETMAECIAGRAPLFQSWLQSGEGGIQIGRREVVGDQHWEVQKDVERLHQCSLQYLHWKTNP